MNGPFVKEELFISSSTELEENMCGCKTTAMKTDEQNEALMIF